MPSGPKWNGLNRHAQEAQDREQQRKSDAKQRESAAREDAMWGDDRDGKQRKADERRAEQQRKDEEARRKKAEREAEYDAELKNADKAPPKHVVQRNMQREVTKNIVAGSMRGGVDIARTPEQQTQPRDTKSSAVDADETGAKARPAGAAAAVPEDRHIGKRARVLYRKFCVANLEDLKSGSGKSLRRSQLNDLLWAMWQKSPENPFVMRAEQRAEEMLNRKWWEATDSDEGAEDGAA